MHADFHLMFTVGVLGMVFEGIRGKYFYYLKSAHMTQGKGSSEKLFKPSPSLQLLNLFLSAPKHLHLFSPRKLAYSEQPINYFPENFSDAIKSKTLF